MPILNYIHDPDEEPITPMMAVRMALDGADLERGRSETAEAAIDNIIEFLGNMMEDFIKRGITAEKNLVESFPSGSLLEWHEPSGAKSPEEQYSKCPGWVSPLPPPEVEEVDLGVGIQTTVSDIKELGTPFQKELGELFLDFAPGKGLSPLYLAVIEFHKQTKSGVRTCSQAFELGIPCIGWFTLGLWDKETEG